MQYVRRGAAPIVKRMKHRPFFGLSILVLGTVVCLVACWYFSFDDEDARGPRYVLWKLGLAPFHASVVYPAMVQDKGRDQLVVGLSEAELTERFTDVRSSWLELNESQRYYTEEQFQGRDIRWLGESSWLVEIEAKRVVSLHLVKG